jgi:RNA polymerase sigma-70 factor (ECF subfamily)
VPLQPDELTAHRAELLRHSYRLLGSYADAEDVVQDVFIRALSAQDTFKGGVPLSHWLLRIATNACLTVLARRKARGLPSLDRQPDPPGVPMIESDASEFVTPAPDAQLRAETRESVAIAFIALLQRLPPKQRAVLLLKDVLGWPSDEIAETLELTVSSVSSALHRARETLGKPPAAPPEPAPDVLEAYVRSWETHDLDGLVALLKKDVQFSMPPHSVWFRGAEAVRGFLLTPRFQAFWARGLKATVTRANGLPALLWHVPQLHSIQLMRFDNGQLAEALNFIGPQYLKGFDHD